MNVVFSLCFRFVCMMIIRLMFEEMNRSFIFVSSKKIFFNTSLVMRNYIILPK